MKKKIALALVATTMFTAASCKDGEPQDEVFTSPLCGPVSGFTLSAFVYGEGSMVIVPVSEVRQGTVFVVALEPLSGFRNADVTVTGMGVGAGWINGSGQYNGLPSGTYPKEGLLEVGCVPNDPIDTSYKYKIEVVEGTVTNTLDPRAKVVN